MAITATARTEVIQLVVAMFNGAPGASVLSDLVTSLGNGTVKQLASNLEKLAVFNGIYPTFLTDQEFADRFLNNLVGEEVASADKASYATTLVAKLLAGASRSSVIIDSINLLKGVDPTNTQWIKGATLFNNKVAVATYYTVDKQLSGSTLAELQNVIASVTSSADSVTTAKASVDSTGSVGLPFTLTTSVNELNGTAGDDTFSGATADVLTAFDKLDGGAGVDTLAVNLTGTSLATPLTISNIEKIGIVTSGGGFTLDTVTSTAGFSKLTDLSIASSAAGAMTVTAATTTNIVTASALTAANNIDINGGLGVRVSSTGASTGTISIGATTASTGAIAVTEGLIAVAGGSTTGAITVKGGTTVNVAVTGVQGTVAGTGNATVGTVTVTGGASTTSATVAQTVAAGTKEVFVATFAVNVDADTITFDGVTVTLTAGQTATQNATKFVTDYNASAAAKTWALTDGLNGTVTFTKATTGSVTNVVNGDFVIASGGAGADTSVTAAAPTTDGKAGIVAGTVAITDVNSTSTTTAGKIATVDLNGFGVATANSSALNTINLAGAGTSFTSQNATVLAQKDVALNLKGVTTTGAVDVGSVTTTLNLVSSTGTNTLGGALTGTAVTAVSISGDKALTLASSSLAANAVITNTATATVTHTAALATGQKYIGSAASDVVNIGVSTVVSDLGGGDDTLTTTGILGTVGRVAGGLGTDTVVMTTAEAAVADNDATFNTKFTSFEVLRLSDALTAANTLDLAGINAVSTVELTAGGANATNSIISNLASGGTIKQTGNGTGVIVQVTNALFNPSDALNLNLSKSSVLAAGTITAAGVETINIAAADATSTGGAAVIHTATLTAANATSIVVTGNNGLNLTATGSVAVTNFDASAVVGNGSTDTAANLAVTYVSVNTTAANAVTIKGGAGNDVLTGVANKDTITGGAGGDIVNGGMGQDTLVVGNGHDVIRIISDINVATGGNAPKGVQSTTAAADIVTGFVLATATTAAADLATAAKFIASTAGGANTAMLSIDLNADAGGDDAGTNVVVAIEANQATATAGVSAGTTYTVLNGILSLAGSGAAAVDTLAEWLLEAAAVSATDGETIGFVYGGDTYVFSQNGTGDSLVQLVGVAATSLVLASGATTLTSGAVVIGDSL